MWSIVGRKRLPIPSRPHACKATVIEKKLLTGCLLHLRRTSSPRFRWPEQPACEQPLFVTVDTLMTNILKDYRISSGRVSQVARISYAETRIRFVFRDSTFVFCRCLGFAGTARFTIWR